jgi:sterol desaturase/sphingolipid hydroxylase (fatty acid hydroxylase superfamily)
MFAFFYFHYLLHWTGYWIAIYPYVLAVWSTGTEFLQYMILGDQDEPYVIKLSNNPSDFLLFPIITTAYLSIPYFYQYTSEILTPVCIFLWVLYMITGDLAFGLLHKLCHTHPYLRKLHMVHHEYRREDLNTFANFYSDFIDALFMNVPGMITALQTIMFSTGTMPLKEITVSLTFVHHKYSNHHMMLGYLFEWDLIDMIMDRVRVSDFHHLHHTLLDQNFSALGFISDEVLIKVYQYLKNGYQSVVRSSKLYNYFKKGLSN